MWCPVIHFGIIIIIRGITTLWRYEGTTFWCRNTTLRCDLIETHSPDCGFSPAHVLGYLLLENITFITCIFTFPIKFTNKQDRPLTNNVYINII